MRKIGLWLMALLVATGLGFVWVLTLRPTPLSAGLLYGNGHIEGTEITVSAEVTGRVLESQLIEGRRVSQGDLLVRLDDTELSLRLAQAKAQARALGLEQARVEAQLNTARHHLKTAHEDLVRYQELRQSATITPQQLNQAENRVEEARAQVETLQARRVQLTAELEAAHRQTDLLALQIDKTQLRAPLDATVLAKGIEVGELAVPGRTVAVLVDLGQLELTVYIPERDIGKLKLGDPAKIRVDAFPKRLIEANVARVDSRGQFTPRDIHMPEERVRLVFGVTLAMANPEGFLKPGMSADAWIRWNPAQPWPERLVVPE